MNEIEEDKVVDSTKIAAKGISVLLHGGCRLGILEHEERNHDT